MPRVGILIQARYNSSRLPGKVTLPLPFNSDQTILDQIILRAKMVKNITDIVVTTSVNPENMQLIPIAIAQHVKYFQGNEQDVLARFYQAANINSLTTIIRFTADNPFIDAELVNEALESHIASNADYTLTSGLPLGTNIEIINFEALAIAHHNATLFEHREHVTPFIRNNSEQFRINNLNFENKKYGSQSWRLTIDNSNDYALACILYQNLYSPGDIFTLSEVSSFIYKQPYLAYINQDTFQKKTFTNLKEELAEGVKLLRFYDFPNAANILKQHLS